MDWNKTGVVMAIILAGALVQPAQAQHRRRHHRKLGPTSVFDVTGQKNQKSTAYDAWAESVTGAQAIGTANGSPVIYPTPGTTLYHALVNTDGTTQCFVASSSNGYRVQLFQESFTTSESTKYLEIHLSTQVAMPAGSTQDGAAIECTVTQGATSVPCSATVEYPYLLRRLSSTLNPLAMVSYHGYAEVNPATPTTVSIFLRTTGNMPAQACYNNLILRF